MSDTPPREVSIILGTNMATSDWVMKMDPLTGEQSQFLLPFLVINRGWYRIVGVDNGVFCIRYSSFGISSHLLVWNPTTGSSRVIPDPPRHFCRDCSYLYSFAYFPNSVNYAVIHIFKQTPDSPSWRLAMYLSLEHNWVVNMECPTFVRRLDPCYASLNGVLYWLHWSMERTDSNPPYMICFCLTNRKFRQISLPAIMRAHCHSLLIKDNKLCVIANDHTMHSYRSTFWQCDNIHNQPTWSRLYSYNGYGSHYLPAAMIDDEIIQVMERHMQMPEPDDAKLSVFHLTRYSPASRTKRSLNMVEFQAMVKIRSLDKTCETIFPV